MSHPDPKVTVEAATGGGGGPASSSPKRSPSKWAEGHWTLPGASRPSGAPGEVGLSMESSSPQ